MADKNPRRNPTTDALFDAILSLETREGKLFLEECKEKLRDGV